MDSGATEQRRETSPESAPLRLRLALVPVAGDLVGLVATVVGLGALAVALWQARTPSLPEAPAPGHPAVAA